MQLGPGGFVADDFSVVFAFFDPNVGLDVGGRFGGGETVGGVGVERGNDVKRGFYGFAVDFGEEFAEADDVLFAVFAQVMQRTLDKVGGSL